MNENVKSNLIVSVILLVIGAAIFLGVFFGAPSPVLYFTLSNSLLGGGATIAALGVLSFVTRSGIFDIVGYSVNTLITSFRKEENKKFHDAYHYKEYKKKRRSLSKMIIFPYLIIGGIELLLAAIFAFIWWDYHNLYILIFHNNIIKTHNI